LKKKLKNIASISTGLYKKPHPVGSVYNLHGKHFDKQGFLKKNALLSKDILMDEKIEKHLLQDKDILFIAKGDNNRACIFDESIGLATASSLFLVIRVDKNRIIPNYLQWLLNSSRTQKKLKQFSKGSHIPSISKKLLKELEIDIPSMEIQQKILNINDLWNQEKQIIQKITMLKEKQYQSVMAAVAAKAQL